MSRDASYAKVMIERQILTCTTLCHETEWMKKLKGEVVNNEKPQTFTLFIDGKTQIPYKLGQVFNAVCYYEPKAQSLYMIREVSEKEANEVGLNKWGKIVSES